MRLADLRDVFSNLSCLPPVLWAGKHKKKAAREVPRGCVSGLGTCPYSYSVIGWWQERLAEVNSGKGIYHSTVAPNAFQMMCPWDARLLLSPSSPARNSLCNYRYYWSPTTKRSCWLVRTVWLHRGSVCPLTLLLGQIFLRSFPCSDSAY